MIRKIFVLALFGISMSLLSIAVASCGSSSNKYVLTPAIDWIEGPDGKIDTWDAKRIQNVVPFKIVFPTYLPEELKDLPPHIIRTFEDGKTNIRIIYQAIEGLGHVDIEEVDILKDWRPNEETEYIYLDIAGISVLEDKIRGYVWQSDQQILETKLHYMWSQDNINFWVVVTDYDKIIARKIVESMIVQ